MELEDQVVGRRLACIPHAVGLAGGAINDAVPPDTPAERLDDPVEDEDRNVVGIDVRRVARSGLQRRGGQAAQPRTVRSTHP